MPDKNNKKVLQSILANQIALDFNEAIKYIPSRYKHKLKQTLNLTIKELLIAEKLDFNPMIDSNIGNQFTDLYAALADVTTLMTRIGIDGFGDIGNILLAYEKSPKSMRGLADKLNKKR
jgi:hypothetical protein